MIYLITVVVGRIIYNRMKANDKKISNYGNSRDANLDKNAIGGIENPGIYVIADTGAVNTDPDDNVFDNAFSSPESYEKFPNLYENQNGQGGRRMRYSSTSSRVTISSEVEEVTSFEYVPPRDTLDVPSDSSSPPQRPTAERKRDRKVSISTRPPLRLEIPSNSEPTRPGIMKKRVSVISNVSGVSNVSKYERRRTLSHSRYLLHHHLDNTIFALTHHHNHDETCDDPRCLIGECGN